MQFCMTRPQNHSRLCFKRRAISRLALPLCSEAFEASHLMTSDVVVPAAETTAANGRVDAHSTAGFKALMLGSIGVVYGDIGTSPLYAFREAVIAASGPSGVVNPLAVLGVLSLILWALIVVVTLKY